MARSKSKKTKARPIVEEELQIKADDEVTELEDADEVQVKSRRDDRDDDEDAEITEVAGDEDAEATELADDDDAAVQLKDEGEEFGFDDGDEAQVKADEDEDEPPADTDDDDEDSIDEGPTSPPARTSKLTVLLILCNWIAAPAFLTYAYLDHHKRAEYSYRTLINYMQIWGLPLKCEEPGAENYAPLSLDTHPRMNLSSKQLEEAFKARPGVTKYNFKEGGIEFAPFEEGALFDKGMLVSATRVPYRLSPSDMKTPGLKKDIFRGDTGPEVDTLEDEIVRLQTSLPEEIEKAAAAVKEALAKLPEKEKRVLIEPYLPNSWDTALEKAEKARRDAASGAELDALVKRAVLRRVLLTLAWNVKQIETLNDKIEKAEGANLDKLLDECVQRRLYYDLLAPLNVFRPGDIQTYEKYKADKSLAHGKIENLCELPLEQVKESLDERLKAALADTHNVELHIGKHWEDEAGKDGMKRTSVEKRHKVAFILFAVSQLTTPIVQIKLYPKGVERAHIVSGLYESTNAMIYYTRSLRILEERYLIAIKADRDGAPAPLKGAKQGAVTNLVGFSTDFEEIIDRMVTLRGRIEDQQRRFADLTAQRNLTQKTHDQRALQHQVALDKLLRARQITEGHLKDLQKIQEQLHDAHKQLAGAGERNEQLYLEIVELNNLYRAEEKRLESLQKGKKRP